MGAGEARRAGWAGRGFTVVAPLALIDLVSILRVFEQPASAPHAVSETKRPEPEPGTSAGNLEIRCWTSPAGGVLREKLH